MSETPRSGTQPLVGRRYDSLWLWAPVPVLGALCLALASLGPLPRDAALKMLFLLNFLHLAATWTRLYGDARHAHRFAAYLLPVLLFAFCALLLSLDLAGPLLLLVFFVNVPHIGMQNYGLIQVASRRDGSASELDRSLDKAYQLAVPLFLALAFASRPGADLFDSRAIGLDKLPLPLLATLGTVVAALALATFARMALQWRAGARVPMERVALHLAYGPGMALCFWLLPPALAPIPLAGTHYIQYLVVVRRFHQRAQQLEGEESLWARVHPLAYLALLALLAPGIPLVVDAALQPLLGGLIPAIGSAASLHHFLADGLIWKLREPRTARLMLS